jgi:hypothetical protein
MSAQDLQNAIGDTLLQVVLQQQAQKKRLQKAEKSKAVPFAKAA